MLSKSVRSTLTYLSDLSIYENEKVYEIWSTDVPSKLPKTNSEFTNRKGVLIEDVRSHKIDLGLDTTGFEWIQHESQTLPTPSSLLLPKSSDTLAPYLQECIALVKERTGAEMVICFDWRVYSALPLVVS
jgi:hypothetical protein